MCGRAVSENYSNTIYTSTSSNPKIHLFPNNYNHYQEQRNFLHISIKLTAILASGKHPKCPPKFVSLLHTASLPFATLPTQRKPRKNFSSSPRASPSRGAAQHPGSRVAKGCGGVTRWFHKLSIEREARLVGRVSVSMATEPAPCNLDVYLNARELRDVIFTPRRLLLALSVSLPPSSRTL